MQTASDTTVMILAAGQGKRMRPLTTHTPKPLLCVNGMSLIEHHLQRLKKYGFRQIVINIDYLGTQIQAALGNGQRFDLDIHYSDESSHGALDTAGGIAKALPLIQSEQFMVINADIWTNYPFIQLSHQVFKQNTLAKLVLVPNPPHNPKGDFNMNTHGVIQTTSANDINYTFSGIGLYKKNLFQTLDETPLGLAQHLKNHIKQGQIQGELFKGQWSDIGTPERLRQLVQSLQ